MGLTSSSSGLKLLKEHFNIENGGENTVIALAGNPNTGKSTVFNGLTGLKQHTGNWPGKTVTQAQGYFTYQNRKYTLVDLPGTYSLLANSTEEIVARDFICFARPDVTIVVADATNLERNLNLLLQVTELTTNVILCLNLMDEAERKNIKIDIDGLEKDLQIPVVPTIARKVIYLEKLKKVVADVSSGKIIVKPATITYSREIKEAVAAILPELKHRLCGFDKHINLQWLALRLLEGDYSITRSIKTYFSEYVNESSYLKQKGGIQIDGVI